VGDTDDRVHPLGRTQSAEVSDAVFGDDDGVIVTPVDSDVNPGAGNYYSLTLAVDWKPSQYLTLRPEARWDWTSGGIKPFDDASAPHQFLLGLQAIYRLW